MKFERARTPAITSDTLRSIVPWSRNEMLPLALGVEIDEECLASPHGERRGEIHDPLGLPHAGFLD